MRGNPNPRLEAKRPWPKR